MDVIFNAVTAYFSGFWGMVELAGSAFSLICVYLAMRHNQWTWFFGALGVICFGFLFKEFQLYSDMWLQVFFLGCQAWGFMVWRDLSARADDNSVTLSTLPFTNVMIVGAIGILTYLTGFYMSNNTDAAFPYADAFTSWMSVFAQILMIRKFWQSWVLWVVLDVFAIGIYFMKDLYVVSGLYVIFLGLAIGGLIKWKRDYDNQKVAVI
jgi:nicotinamide mononucleotide transporter